MGRFSAGHGRKAAWRVLAATALLGLLGGPVVHSSADELPSMAAVPRAHCGPGAKPETAAQGRVPAADYASGRAAQGYMCNTREVGHYGQTAGLKVFRYRDPAGHSCAFYDSTQFFPTDAMTNLTKDGLGVVALDMSDPANPRKVANLVTPAMLTPHESMVLSQERGLLVAVAGNLVTYPGVVDVYDVREDCRAPKLLSSTPFGVLGHESAMSPDGRTFYASSTYGEEVSAVDLTDPTKPQLLWTDTGRPYHGMTVSDDGNRLYVAYIGQPPAFDGGLKILDVSQIQARKVLPQITEVGAMTWPSRSIPQIPVPMTIHGHKYLLEVDEFNTPDGVVGAARMINVDNDRRPYLVSNIRLEVHQPANRTGTDQQTDPGAPESPYGGYTAHYCSVPRRDDPGLAACSFIGSGLRIFDIRDPAHPAEVGYFNKPTSKGAHALSAPSWDVANDQVWYSDVNSGFYGVQLTNGIAGALHPAGTPESTSPGASASPPSHASQPRSSGAGMPSTAAAAGQLPETGGAEPGLAIAAIASGMVLAMVSLAVRDGGDRRARATLPP